MFNTKLKVNSLETDETPREIIIKTANLQFPGFPYNYIEARRTVVTYRKKNSYSFDANYDIPQEIMVTKRGLQFLYFDSGMEDLERILIFTTQDNIAHLAQNKIWLCDGTFFAAPTGYEQLFTVQCFVRGKHVPLVHIFMKNRTSDS